MKTALAQAPREAVSTREDSSKAVSANAHVFCPRIQGKYTGGNGNAAALRWRSLTFVGLRMTKPSFTSLRMFWRELAMEISLICYTKEEGRTSLSCLSACAGDAASPAASASTPTPGPVRGKKKP